MSISIIYQLSCVIFLVFTFFVTKSATRKEVLVFVFFQTAEHVHDDDADEPGSPISTGWRSSPDHARNRQN